MEVQVEPFLVPIYTKYAHKKPDAVSLLSLSEDTVKRLVSRGELESVLEGGRRLVVVESIRAYVERRRQEARSRSAA